MAHLEQLPALLVVEVFRHDVLFLVQRVEQLLNAAIATAFRQRHGTEEMMQPCLIYLHAISLGWGCDRDGVLSANETAETNRATSTVETQRKAEKGTAVPWKRSERQRQELLLLWRTTTHQPNFLIISKAFFGPMPRMLNTTGLGFKKMHRLTLVECCVPLVFAPTENAVGRRVRFWGRESKPVAVVTATQDADVDELVHRHP